MFIHLQQVSAVYCQ